MKKCIHCFGTGHNDVLNNQCSQCEGTGLKKIKQANSTEKKIDKTRGSNITERCVIIYLTESKRQKSE